MNKEEDSMLLKLSRIFGIAGGVLASLVSLGVLIDCVYGLSLPADMQGDFTYDILIAISAYVVVALAGLAFSLFIFKRSTLYSALTLVAGALTAFITAQWLSCYIYPSWPYIIPAVLLIAAGSLALLEKRPAPGNSASDMEALPLTNKLSRALGIVGGMLSLALWLSSIYSSIIINEIFPLRSWLLDSVYFIIVLAGITFGIVAFKQPRLNGLLMLLAAVLLGFLVQQWAIGFTELIWLYLLPLSLLAAAGILILAVKKPKAADNRAV
jgi:hypothetical protein